jgi:hypothetical protein
MGAARSACGTRQGGDLAGRHLYSPDYLLVAGSKGHGDGVLEALAEALARLREDLQSDERHMAQGQSPGAIEVSRGDEEDSGLCEGSRGPSVRSTRA